VPKFWNLEDLLYLENELKDLGMNIESLREFDEKELITHLERLHFDWNHFELFADFLLAFSKESQFDFQEKAIAIYDYVQQESKIFSFEIFKKLAAAKANL
jgi:tRNA A37 methylthiotransferase MiaB